MAKKVNLTPTMGGMSSKMKILFYGWPGSGKTRTSATACLVPELSPVLWLDARGNPESIRNYPSQPHIIRVEQLEDFNDPFIWIYNGQPKDAKFAKDFGLAGAAPFKTLVIDQLTDVQLMMFSKKQNPQGTLPGNLANKREWDDYNTVLYTMWNFAKEYYSLAERGLIHVIMTAQEISTEEGGAQRSARPYLEGKSSVMVASYASIVGRLMSGDQLPTNVKKKLPGVEDPLEVESIAGFKRTQNFEAKDQYGGLPDVMINPTLSKMLDCFRAYEAKPGRRS